MAWIVRMLLLGAFLWLAYILFTEVQVLRDMPPDEPGYDPTAIVLHFLGIIALGIGIGVVVATTILPELGDKIGSFFYDSGEQLEKDPHKDAVALVNQGDYVAAIHAYQKIVDKNPDDLHALSEVVHLQCEKLQLHDDAVEYLEKFLADDLAPERTAFLAERLVDVHWLYKKDAETAVPILRQIIEVLPETKYAANAFHRIHDIERAVQEAEMHERLAARAAASAEPRQPAAEDEDSAGAGGGDAGDSESAAVGGEQAADDASRPPGGAAG